MRHHLTIAVIVAAAIASAVPAVAQSPSADQIIRSLRPTAPGATNRGIRQISPGDAAPAGAAPSPGAAHVSAGMARPSTAAPPAAVARSPSVNLTVNFPSGSADVTPQAARALDALGSALTSPSLAGFRFRIEGHTDTVGTPDSNRALSERRAAAVVDYLGTKWGVDKSKVEAVGKGQDQLLVPTGPNVAQPKNRRVTVINVGA